jgi:hypothetical protein
VKVETKNFLVLTAPTAELQTIILKYTDDEKAFPLKESEELRSRLRGRAIFRIYRTC